MGIYILFLDTDDKITGDWELQAWGAELTKAREEGGCGLGVCMAFFIIHPVLFLFYLKEILQLENEMSVLYSFKITKKIQFHNLLK